MPFPSRAFSLMLIPMVLAASVPSSPAGEPENYRQLQAMPRERRVALSENLDRFDKLPPSEQAAIRKLDADITRKDSVEQARYRVLLRRYHLWVNGLTEEQKEALKSATSPEARFNLARKFRIKDLETASATPRIAGIRTGEFGLIGPYEMVKMLKIWEKMPQPRRLELEQKLERGEFRAALLEQPDLHNLGLKSFGAEDLKAYESRFENDPEYKLFLRDSFQKTEAAQRAEAARLKAEAAEKKTEAAQKKAENARRKADNVRKLAERPYAEFLYFEDHKPRPVAQKNLERFTASCPQWLHTMIDPLSPDDARAYMTAIYRLMYSDIAEMPPESKAAKPASTPPPASPKVAPKKSANSDPF